MSNISDTLNAIKLTNNLYNAQISSLIKTVQDDSNQIVLKTQTDLITKISQDYNISIRELTRKYISKPKKTRKVKDDIEDSPTMQTINDVKNNHELSDDESNSTNITNIVVKNISSPFLPATNLLDDKKDSNNQSENNVETPNTSEVLYKTIKIKNSDYLLNISTNEIYDMENNLIGRKQNNKYLIKK